MHTYNWGFGMDYDEVTPLYADHASAADEQPIDIPLRTAKDWAFIRTRLPGFDFRVIVNANTGATRFVLSGQPRINGKLVSRRKLLAYCRGERQFIFDPTPDTHIPRPYEL